MRTGIAGIIRIPVIIAIVSAFGLPAPGTAVPAAGSAAWQSRHVLAVDDVGDVPAGFEGADLLAFYFEERPDELRFRVSMAMMRDPARGTDLLSREAPRIVVLLDYGEGGRRSFPAGIAGEATIAWDEAVVLDPPEGEGVPGARPFSAAPAPPEILRIVLDRGSECIEAGLSVSPAFAVAARSARAVAVAGEAPAKRQTPVSFEIVSVSGGRIVDRIEASTLRPLSPGANCAFVHHGNQGLAYSDVFRGRWDDPEGSGFDEALQVHEATSIPGNFHLCGPLQVSAEWDANNGDPVDFNAWLAAGVSAGWAGMVTSAWGQHMMPFVQNAMNDWAVNIQTQMTDYRYGYYPRVAWVPERVWLDPYVYPNAGVIDNLVDNWVSHGVWAVILDDDVHCQGYDNHQVHQFNGSALKVLPRDRSFTGNIVGGNGAAALQILTDLSNSGYGDYRIVCYAEDWEAAAEMGSWATTTPNAKETYDWFINKCSAESAWISVWKVADAVTNPDFQGSASFNVTYGTYNEIGGTGGYGGGDNGWYTHWAGYIPYATGGDGAGYCDSGRGGSCKDHGTIWNDAYNALMASPSNDISEAGWYTMMTNLHETGWHDYLGGPISGWQLRYSGHIKNAGVYAEASHWANGEYASATGAYFTDIDGDGWDELVMHNDRVFAVFESIGARATHVFARGTGYTHSIVGVDVAYWAGTEGDYNDVNHVGLLSDVGPNYQHSLYDMTVVQGSGSTVEARFSHENLKKTVKMTLGTTYMDIIYDVGQSTQYIKNGFSPGLVDLLWSARMDRVWAGDAAYFGQRNPNNGATAAIVVGSAGGAHNFEISGRIMKGDEIFGSGVFEFLFYAGTTGEPVGGEIAELRALASLVDTIGPMPRSAVYFPGTDKLRIGFNQVTRYATVVATGVSIDDDYDGTADLTLSGGTTVVETEDGFELTLQLTPTDAAALEALSTGTLELLLDASSFFDEASNPNGAVTGADDVAVSYGPATMITIDGYIDTAEWGRCRMAVADSNDSEWNAANEIDALYVTWDNDYLYIALDGIVSGNSWLIYLDTDPDGPGGETDLTAIDAWERGTVFTAPGFRADFQYGCYQHQGIYDSDSFFRIESPTATVDLSDSIVSAFDADHLGGDLGGSELAVPWEILYGLGPGTVTPGASISIVASLCWDPEPEGVLGGDSAPSNTSASLPTIDAVYSFTVDADADGVPDQADDVTPPELVEARRDASSDSLVNVLFSEPVDPDQAEDTANWQVYRTDVVTTTVDVLSAVVLGDGMTVRLALAHAIQYGWTCAAQGIADLSCNANELLPGSTVMIRGALTGDDGREVPYPARLYQNYPNPFNPSTVIRFDVPGRAAGAGGAPVQARVVLAVFDVQGRLVRTLVDRVLPAGPAEAVWDGTNGSGVAVSSGIYFIRMVSAGQRMTRKMVLLR